MTSTLTHCPYCALQCGMILENTDGTLTVAPRNDFPTNRGGLCRKGWTSVELINHPQRLTTPLIRDRKGGALRVATWGEALDFTAAAFSRIQELHGRDAVAHSHKRSVS